MAQKISNDEYNRQSTDYTKRALEELNEQMKDFYHNKELNDTIIQEESEDESSPDSFFRGEKRKRIIIESSDHAKSNSPKKYTKKEVDYKSELKIQELKTEIKCLEIKNYNLTLQLSNSNCELQETKEEVSVLQKRLHLLFRMRFIVMFYLLFSNSIAFFYSYSFPPYEFILSFLFFTGYVYGSIHLYKKLFPNIISTKKYCKKNI